MLDEARTILPFVRPSSYSGKKKEKERVEDAFSSSPRIREERWREDATPLTDRVRHNGRESGNNDFSRCSQNFRPSYCHVSALLRLLSRAFFFLFLFLWNRKIEQLLSTNTIHGEIQGVSSIFHCKRKRRCSDFENGKKKKTLISDLSPKNR